MPPDAIFAPIDMQQLKERLKFIEIAYDLIAVTLTGGDILLGGIFKHWKWNGRTVTLNFNTADGKCFGFSHIIDVPIDLIAGISTIPLDDASIPRIEPDDVDIQLLQEIAGEIDTRIPVQDYPNPLASIIYEHNIQVASLHGFHIGDYAELELPQSAIPPEGIEFNEDFLLYVDWAFFSQQMAGSVSVSAGIPGVGSISKDLSQPPQMQVLQRLRASLAEKVRKRISQTTGEYTLQGCILVPEPRETTTIEGEECHLCTVVENRDDGEVCPLLLKVNALKYPFEFLSHVNSVLTFYGELLPIPLEILSGTYQKLLLARAIGYLHKKE